MADPTLAPTIPTFFPYTKWSAEFPRLKLQFQRNQPYPHVHLKEFLEPEAASRNGRGVSGHGDGCLDPLQTSE